MRRVLIADDHPMFSTALELAVHAVDQAILIDASVSLEEALRALSAATYDLILLDLVLPDASGLAGLAELRLKSGATPIAIVSSKDDPAIVAQTLRMGVRGYIAKTTPMSEMVAAIRVILGGGQWFPGLSEAMDRIASDDIVDRLATLSPAQLRVLKSVASGKQNKQIAFELELSEPTIKTHLVSIYRKLGVTNRTQAVLAYESVSA